MYEVKRTLNFLPDLRDIVKRKDPKYFNHTTIDNQEITPDTISIVMTSHNRSRQVYYTLKTISNSSHKNVQVILVDDSTVDPVDVHTLRKYPFYIDFIQINRDNKYWKNPCVNYNIGFEYIKGDIVVIQNGEVCHVGDVLNKLKTGDGIQDDQYYVFDVTGCKNYDVNEKIYKIDRLSTDIYAQQSLWQVWYQHHRAANRSLHFLVALTANTFRRVEGFSYDYSFVSWYDDDDFLLKIKTLGIAIVLIPNETEKVGGIHLFHTGASNTSGAVTRGKELFGKKVNYHNAHKIYLEISEGPNIDDLNYRFECLYHNRPIV